MSSKSFIGIAVVAVVILIGGVLWYNNTPGKYDSFAQCISDNGSIFYGAFWCPHCQNQKTMFGKSEKYLPYVECSTPNGQAQLQICIDAGVTNYPTWEFPDGERLTGEVALEVLAEKTGCELPQ